MDYPRALDSSPEDRGLGVRDCISHIPELSILLVKIAGSGYEIGSGDVLTTTRLFTNQLYIELFANEFKI